MADITLAASFKDISSSCDESLSNNEVEITEDEDEEPAVTSLLQKLKAPKKSELSRKRKILSLPPTGKKRSSGRHGLKQPKVSPSQRVKEFPNEQLSALEGYYAMHAGKHSL